MIKVYVVLFLVFSSASMFGQTPPKKEPIDPEEKQRQDLERSLEKMRRNMQEQFEREHKEMEKMLGGGMLKRFEKLFNDMQNDNAFDQMRKALEQMGQDDIFQGFGNLGGGLGKDDYQWVENEKERVLILKIQVVKDAPFDIKVKDGKITVAGTFEKKHTYEDPSTGAKSESIQRNSFVRSFQVPGDTDPSKVRIEQIKDQIHIILPKHSSIGVKKTSPKAPIKKTDPTPKLKPVKPKKGDVTI